ncbi:hypothetical protein J6590_045884 [Homalodisca vitripennis]|nr:hypothetical protein J6590_045884 [Homalodisca vitripennis]
MSVNGMEYRVVMRDPPGTAKSTVAATKSRFSPLAISYDRARDPLDTGTDAGLWLRSSHTDGPSLATPGFVQSVLFKLHSLAPSPLINRLSGNS